MKVSIVRKRPVQSTRAVTILELSVVLAIILALVGMFLLSFSGYRRWTMGKDASVELQTVYLAQKSYLADHPTEDVASLEADDLLPYMASGQTAIPQIKDLDGAYQDIDFSVIPPVVDGGYDPSGDAEDGLWDVGTP